LQELQALQDELTAQDLHGLVGETMQILVEGPSSKQGQGTYRQWKGREPGGRVVNFNTETKLDLTGQMLQAQIKQAKKHSLWGEVTEQS
jgi:tRNA-2-methylthio-N6-dimethylallyladenosine synthase